MQPPEATGVAPIVNSALYPYKALSSLFKHTTYDPAALPTNDNDADPVFRIPSASRTHDGCEEHAPSKTLALTGAAAASNITVAAAGIAIDTANDKSDDFDEALEEDPDVEQRNILSVVWSSPSPGMLEEAHSTGAVELSMKSSPSDGRVT